MASSLIRPTGEAGVYEIAGRKVTMVAWREGDVYDTTYLTGAAGAGAGGAVAAGTELIFFRDVANKNRQHTNLKTPRRLPSGTELIVARVGVHIMQAIGSLLCTDADIIQLAHAGFFILKVGERIVTEAPLITLQSGYGVTGSTTRNATGIATVGVASAAAAPQLLVAQPIDTERDLDAVINFYSVDWLNQAAPNNLGAQRFPSPSVAMGLQVFLHGFIKLAGGAT